MATGFVQRFKGKIIAAGGSIAQAGRAIAATFGFSGNLSINVTAAPSAATNTLQTLMTYSLPANALNATNSGLFITAWGSVAGNAAPKSINLNVGGVKLASGTSTQSGVSWYLWAEVFKTGGSAQTMVLGGQIGTVFITPKTSTDTSVDTGAIVVSVTATDDSAATSNVVDNGLVITYFN